MSDQEITAEFSIEELAPEPIEPPIAWAKVTMAAKTDLGLARENNEDKFDWLEPEDEDTLARRGRLYAVADGMGGHSAGQIASEIALKTLIRDYFLLRPGDVYAALTAAMQGANALVWETGRHVPGRNGMGTTLTAMVIYGDKAIIGHIGDSRAYLLRSGSLDQVTEDHSWVAEQVSAGLMTEEEALASPYRNIITRSIGSDPEIAPDLYEIQLQAGDILLLCSDGLTGPTEPETMKEALDGNSPSVAALRLIEAANERGGPDNITCLILRVDEIIEDSAARSEAADKGREARSEGSPAVKVETESAASETEANGSAQEPPNRQEKEKRSRGWLGWKR